MLPTITVCTASGKRGRKCGYLSASAACTRRANSGRAEASRVCNVDSEIASIDERRKPARVGHHSYDAARGQATKARFQRRPEIPLVQKQYGYGRGTYRLHR